MSEYQKDVARPERGLEFGSDVFIPFTWSVVTGGLAAALVALLDIGGGGVRVFWLGFVVVALVTWLWLLFDAERRVFWYTEHSSQVSRAESVAAGSVDVSERPVVRVEVASGQTLQFLDLEGLDVARLETFCQLALEGRLTERQVASALGLARGDWQVLRDNMMARGLLQWNNGQSRRHGVALTRRGADVLGGVLDGARLLTDGDS